MSPDQKDAVVFAHKAKIERYRQILEIFLFAEERRFVERRSAGEEAALEQIEDRLSYLRS